MHYKYHYYWFEVRSKWIWTKVVFWKSKGKSFVSIQSMPSITSTYLKMSPKLFCPTVIHLGKKIRVISIVLNASVVILWRFARILIHQIKSCKYVMYKIYFDTKYYISIYMYILVRFKKGFFHPSSSATVPV